MLPFPTSKEFPEALKAAREKKGLTFTQLAHAISINPAMPSRYENRDHSCFCAPRQETWEKLNSVLFGSEEIPAELAPSEALLAEATVEEIIRELKARGATSVSISY